MELTFSILSPTDYELELKQGCPLEDLSTEAEKETLRTEIFATRQLVVDALESKWKVEDDFEVGWDFDYYYYLCGGIYSSRIVCQDYLITLAATLAKTSSSEKWTYLTSCESDDFGGEFFIRDNNVFIGSDSQGDLLSKLGAA